MTEFSKKNICLPHVITEYSTFFQLKQSPQEQHALALMLVQLIIQILEEKESITDMHHLAILAIIIHIYSAIWVKGSIRAMTRGTVSAAWAKHHHPAWYKEIGK